MTGARESYFEEICVYGRWVAGSPTQYAFCLVSLPSQSLKFKLCFNEVANYHLIWIFRDSPNSQNARLIFKYQGLLKY